MKRADRTPEQAQLIEMLAIGATGRHNVVIAGSERQIENAVRWIPKILPVLNRDQTQTVKTTWSRHSRKARTQGQEERAPVVRLRREETNEREALLGSGTTPGLVHLAHTGAVIIDGINERERTTIADVCRLTQSEHDHQMELATRTVIIGTMDRKKGSGPAGPEGLWALFDAGWQGGSDESGWDEPTEEYWRNLRLTVEAGRNHAEQRPQLPGDPERVRAASMNLDQVERSLFLMTPKVEQWWNELSIEPSVRRRRGAVARTVADLGRHIGVNHADFATASQHNRLLEKLAADI